MKKLILVLIILCIGSTIVFAEGLSVEERQIIKDRIKANDPGRDLLLDQLLRETNGAEISFALPYLNDPRADVRAIIAEKLGFYGDVSFTIPALLKAREDESPEVREKVAKSLLIRGKTTEVIPVFVRLIKEGQIYHGLMNDITSIRSGKDREELKKGLLLLQNGKDLTIQKRAYIKTLLLYEFNEPFADDTKQIMIEAIKKTDNGSALSDITPVYRMVMRIWTSKQNLTITKEDCVDLLSVAKGSSVKRIADEANKSLELISK
jgi:hypothetical protein